VSDAPAIPRWRRTVRAVSARFRAWIAAAYRWSHQRWMRFERRSRIALAAIGGVLLACVLMRLIIGSHQFGLPSGPGAEHVMEARRTYILLAVIVGAALSISGVSLQALLRNHLAEPFILGLSTGAAAGVMAQRWLTYQLQWTPGPSYTGALAGALASITIVFLAGRRRGVIDPLGLLLTGVILSTVNGALIMAFNYLAGQGGMRDELARWMMGYLNESIGAGVIVAVALVTACGLGLLLWQSRAMDVATLSDAEAESLGVHVGRLRLLLFMVSGVLAAGAVVLAGPIAFVGLVCPHIARLCVGPRHGPLLVASAMLGAALLILADTASALIAYTRADIGLMPLGVFTAVIGGPVFLWMLRPQLGRGLE
jgi:iron complex transport system permease protein